LFIIVNVVYFYDSGAVFNERTLQS